MTKSIVYYGADHSQSGQVKEVVEYPDPPAPDPIPVPTVPRIRFDAVFAEAIGEVAFDDVLDMLNAMAVATPKTETSVVVKRTLRGLANPAGIDYPESPWRTPNAGDLTATFLKLAHDVLVQSDPDIATKIDAGLATWPKV